MSDVQNAPGPWKSDGQGSYIFDAKGDIIVQIRGWGHLQYLGEDVALKTQEEIQRRIVAAVNACRKIPTVVLEADEIPDSPWTAWTNELTRERDEARAMVKELAEMVRSLQWGVSSRVGGEYCEYVCPKCGQLDPVNYPMSRGHTDCELEALVKRAEVLS